MSEPHLDLLALMLRLLKAIGAGDRPGNVPGMLMDIARDLARWFLWAALRFEWANVAVQLARAIKKRLALMHGAACSTLLSAGAVVDVTCRIILKVLREKVSSSRFDLSNIGICGAMPFSSTSQFSIGAAP